MSVGLAEETEVKLDEVVDNCIVILSIENNLGTVRRLERRVPVGGVSLGNYQAHVIFTVSCGIAQDIRDS